MIAWVMLLLRIVMALAVYAFLALAISQLWRELRRQAQGLTTPSIPGLRLEEVLEEAGDQPARRFLINEMEVTVGRDSTCEVVLDDATISARHALLSYHHGQWWASDLKSKNGTFINGQPVSVATVLAAGDELRCGELGFILSIEELAQDY